MVEAVIRWLEAERERWALRQRVRRICATGAPARAGVKACCQEPGNLKVIERASHVLVRRCSVCQCRHFTALAGQSFQPGHYGIR